jgi:hypothetical protein
MQYPCRSFIPRDDGEAVTTETNSGRFENAPCHSGHSLEDKPLMLTKKTVEEIARFYPGGKQGDRESKLFSTSFRQKIRVRGHLEVDELVDMVAWKSERQKSNAAKNSRELVQKITGLSFSVDNPGVSNWILCYLKGVQARVASGILTVFDPDRYTVMDYRAWDALNRLNLLSALGLSPTMSWNDPATYVVYLSACKHLANQTGVDLRTLDHCLWVISGDDSAEYGLASHGKRLSEYGFLDLVN